MRGLATAQNFSSFSVSVYTSPTPLGKRIALKPNGATAKKSLGHIVDGTVRRETFESLTQFAEFREELTANDALGYGLTGHPIARVVTKADLASMSDSEKVSA